MLWKDLMNRRPLPTVAEMMQCEDIQELMWLERGGDMHLDREDVEARMRQKAEQWLEAMRDETLIHGAGI